MKGTLLILAVLCACTFAMVPRDRIPREANREICAPSTPCSWDVFRENSKVIYMTVENSYCVCEEGMECTQDNEDSTASAYVYKCKTKNT